jgi:hypothetical protein
MLTVPRQVSPLARVSVRKTKRSRIYKDLDVDCPQVSPILKCVGFLIVTDSREEVGTLRRWGRL